MRVFELKNGVECESFTVISAYSLLVYKSKYTCKYI